MILRDFILSCHVPDRFFKQIILKCLTTFLNHVVFRKQNPKDKYDEQV